jgi:hypothetical protein
VSRVCHSLGVLVTSVTLLNVNLGQKEIKETRACLTMSIKITDLCPASSLTDLAQSGSAASKGIVETDEKPITCE